MLSHQCEKFTRPATTADISAIIDIVRVTAKTTYVMPLNKNESILSIDEQHQYTEQAELDYLRHLNDENHLTYVALDDVKIVGFARIVKKEDYAYLDKIYLLPGQKNKNYGLRLLISCFKNAMDIFSVNIMKLYVWNENRNAINFYLKNDFVNSGKSLFHQFSSGEYQSPEMVCSDIKMAYLKAIKFLGPQSNMAWNEYTNLDNKGAYAKPEKVTEKAASAVINSQLPLVAIDIGAGKGRDTRYLLEKGFKVLAIESNEQACSSLQALATDMPNRLSIQQQDFDSMNLSQLPESASLVNASFSLPYAGPDKIESVIAHLAKKLVYSGKFCGQFFGRQCSFVSDFHSKVAAHSQPEIVELLNAHQLEVEECTPEIGEGTRMDGSICHKEYYHVIARKI